MATAVFQLWKSVSDGGSEASANTEKQTYFLSVDATLSDMGAYPVAVPGPSTSNYNYSYELFLKWKMTSAPDNSVTNLHFWGSSEPPASGVSILAGTTTAWHVPVSTKSSYAIGTVDAHYTGPSNYLVVIPSTSTNTFLPEDLNEFTSFLVIQMAVASTAERGVLPDMIFYLQYDEA